MSCEKFTSFEQNAFRSKLIRHANYRSAKHSTVTVSRKLGQVGQFSTPPEMTTSHGQLGTSLELQNWQEWFAPTPVPENEKFLCTT